MCPRGLGDAPPPPRGAVVAHRVDVYWRCKDRRCRARLTTSLPPALVLHNETDGSLAKRAKGVDDNNRLTLFTNKSGNTGIIVDGQKFRIKKVRKDSCIVWRCIVDRPKCRSNVVTTAECSLVSVGDHNHTLPSRPRLLDLATAAETEMTDADTTDPPPAMPTVEPPHSVGYVQSERRHSNILYNGYKYYFLRSVTDYCIWRCAKNNCHLYIRTDSDKIIKETGTHIIMNPLEIT